MKKSSAKKLIIIPAYNEAPLIARTIREVRASAPDFDFIVINDCSRDDTARICEENGAALISHAVNLGIGGAMQTGYRYAWDNGYECAVQIDGDGQHDPAFLGEMYRIMIREKADMVIGSRFAAETGYRAPLMRRWGIRYFSALIRLLTGVRITDPTSGMRMIGRKQIRMFAQDYPADYPEPETLVRLLLKEQKVIEVPVRMRRRTAGRSSIRLKDSAYYLIKVTLAILAERIRNLRK